MPWYDRKDYAHLLPHIEDPVTFYNAGRGTRWFVLNDKLEKRLEQFFHDDSLNSEKRQTISVQIATDPDLGYSANVITGIQDCEPEWSPWVMMRRYPDSGDPVRPSHGMGFNFMSGSVSGPFAPNGRSTIDVATTAKWIAMMAEHTYNMTITPCELDLSKSEVFVSSVNRLVDALLYSGQDRIFIDLK